MRRVTKIFRFSLSVAVASGLIVYILNSVFYADLTEPWRLVLWIVAITGVGLLLFSGFRRWLKDEGVVDGAHKRPRGGVTRPAFCLIIHTFFMSTVDSWADEERTPLSHLQRGT